MRARLVIVTIVAGLCIQLLTWPPITKLLDEDKCPACYGTSLCPAFTANEMGLDTSSVDSIIFNLIRSKNAVFGVYSDQRVVLKKLGHKTELASLDDMICTRAGFQLGCNVSEALEQQDNLFSKLKDCVSQPFTSSLYLCPSPTHLEKLLSYYENSKNDSKTLLANVWTSLSVNPEPLILQILRAEYGWPVPKYFGACGRIIVEEYVGEMLYTFHAAPWILRANLSYQLLVAAFNFTHSHPDFSFYLTDISPDNIAVSSAGMAKFVDLENIIVLDKNTPEEDKPITWDELHVSESFDCDSDGCLAFSPQDICSHKTSDHNIYAVCHTLLHPRTSPSTLSGGLLHDPPPEHSHIIMQLIDDCAESTERIAAAGKLMAILIQILQPYE